MKYHASNAFVHNASRRGSVGANKAANKTQAVGPRRRNRRERFKLGVLAPLKGLDLNLLFPSNPSCLAAFKVSSSSRNFSKFVAGIRGTWP